MKQLRRIASITIMIVMLLALNATAWAENNDVGSITVHKYEVSSLSNYTIRGDGTELDANFEVNATQKLSDLIALPGIQFKITAVQLKSAAPAGSNVVNDYEAVTDSGAFSNTKTTIAGGIAKWENLPYGIYKIEELEGATADEATDPFLVSVPMTNPTGNGWLTDIHVYPKNTVTGPDIGKELVTPTQGGNVLTWKISVDVPNDIADSVKLEVTDELSSRLKYVTDSATAYYTDKDGVKSQPLSGSDYQVSYNTTGGANTLTFTMTTSGFTKLANALLGTDGRSPKLYFEFGTTVALNQENPNWTPISNIADLDFTNSAGHVYDTKETSTSTSTSADLYGIEIYKVDGDSRELDGAIFKVYPAEASAKAGTGAIQSPSGTGDWTVTTEEDGLAHLYGLTYGTYWLVETQAPVGGYNLLSGPVRVVIPDGYEDGDGLPVLAVRVVNNKGFTLPITGGSGTVMFTLVGIGLIVAACAFLFFSRKKARKIARKNAAK